MPDLRRAVLLSGRASAYAKREGPAAVRLERLVTRDGWSVREAIELMCSEDASLSARWLGERARQFPPRAMRRDVPINSITALREASTLLSDDEVIRREEDSQMRDDIVHALIKELPDEDQAIFKMRFWDGMRLATIARVLHVDQLSLYPRSAKLLNTLRNRLLELGYSADRVREMACTDEAP